MAKTLTGFVSSDRGDKTIVVTIRTRKTHPIYKKQYSISKKFMAHDENNEAKVGDQVIISETKPISARKRFKLDSIVERATIRHEDIAPEIVQEIAKPKKSDKEPESVTEPPVKKVKKEAKK